MAKVLFSVRINSEILNKIKFIAQELEVSVSEVVRKELKDIKVGNGENGKST